MNDIGFVEKEMRRWKDQHNVAYVVNLERRMAEVFYPTFYKQYVETQDSVDSIFRPPHFYGEIGK